MTTPTSVLGMSHIQTEFGGSNPIAISEYYGVNANVPASGTIAMSKFLGISAASVSLAAQSGTDTDYSGGVTLTECRFRANGQQSIIYSGGGLGNQRTWLTGGSSSDFQMKFMVTSGTPTNWTNAANNTWYAMSTDRGIYVSTVGIGYAACGFRVAIRRASDSVEVANVAGFSIVAESKK